MKINRLIDYIYNCLRISTLQASAILPILALITSMSVRAEHRYTLDKEGLTGRENVYTDPIKLFNEIKDLTGTVTIEVAPSVYWLDNPDDPEIRIPKKGEGIPFAIELNCDTLNIIGLAENPEDVVFAVNRGQTQGAVGNFTIFKFRGKQLSTENITYGNYCNLDLEYPRDPSQNRAKRKDAIVQAQIGICEGTEKLVAHNCRFLSRLNLCPFIGARRTLFNGCYFECTDDALSGSAVYHKCGFTFFSSKPFYGTDKTGAIFLDCDILSKCNGPQYFTKVPGMITAIDTRFTSDAPIDIRWTRDTSDVRCFQQNITLNDEPVIIDDTRRGLSTILDDSPLLDAYKFEYDGKSYYNLSNLLNGNDGWDPMLMDSITKAAETEYGNHLRGLPVALRITAEDRELEAYGDTLILTTTPLLWGGFPTGEERKIEFVSNNPTPKGALKTLSAGLPSGLRASYTVRMKPFLKAAPEIIGRPKVFFDKKDGVYRVNYKLTGDGDDSSHITWGRAYKDGRTEAVKKGQGESGRTYRPTAADKGYHIAALIYPGYTDTKYGNKYVSNYTKVGGKNISEIVESYMATDFSDVPVIQRKPGKKGLWIFDTNKPKDTYHVDWEAADEAGWYYGKGFDASTGEGLVQTVRGARLSYVPQRDGCKRMEVTVIAEPAKSGGQGFGSATKQYMDVCVKFDPETLTGYALRMERTSDHDRAVVFSLIKYENGETSEISRQMVSDCYRNPCTIKISADNDMLYATASTEAPATRKCCDQVADKVDLNASIEASDRTGFCIQHTGTTGPSSTLIRNVELNWE